MYIVYSGDCPDYFICVHCTEPFIINLPSSWFDWNNFENDVKHLPASVSQSDAPQTGDQEVAGLIPNGPGNILLWRLIMKYFL